MNNGDIGHVSAAGLVCVTGRANDVSIRSVHNTEPGVSAGALTGVPPCCALRSSLLGRPGVLTRRPRVQFAAAMGWPDEYAGEMPVAFVVLNAAPTVSVTELNDFVKLHLPERPAHPRRIDVWTTLQHETNEGIATTTFHRPDPRNALTPKVL